ncbi:MAG: aminoglycoside phosphotransferase family protein [Chloroflexi bacterium]|nr:aminoglycoside phosphotransferase family protein [Chloroflexota bacterium]
MLTIPTTDGTVWFKACGPGTAHEARLYPSLARWAAPHVLEPIAVDAERAWLLLPDGGVRLRDRVAGGPGIEAWQRILPIYAELQRRLETRVPEMLGLGVPDQHPATMPGYRAALIEDSAVGLAEDDRRRLIDADAEYLTRCKDLAADGIAPTVQHDDLHAGNVLVDGGLDRIFDWGDAAVAHPFGTMLVTLRSIASRGGHGTDPTGLERLRDAYLEPWTDRHARPALVRSVDNAVHVATIGRALAWRRALSGIPRDELGEDAEAVPGWLLESLAEDPLDLEAS